MSVSSSDSTSEYVKDLSYTQNEMLTFKQWCMSKRKITQAQRAQIPYKERAQKIVIRMIEEALAQNYDVPEGLLKKDLDCIFNTQPVHFDGLGYVPHWFQRQDIKWWGEQICAYLHPNEVQRK